MGRDWVMTIGKVRPGFLLPREESSLQNHCPPVSERSGQRASQVQGRKFNHPDELSVLCSLEEKKGGKREGGRQGHLAEEAAGKRPVTRARPANARPG